MSQIKEQENTPEKNPNEIEISDLPNKEFNDQKDAQQIEHAIKELR